MQNIVIIHGMSCGLDECFGLGLKEKLHRVDKYNIIEPKFAIHPNITLEKWIDEMDKFIDKLGKDSIFVCHSLGTLFVIKYMHLRKIKSKCLICVAGGYPDRVVDPNTAYLEPFMPNSEDFEWVKSNCPIRYNIFNSKDHIWTQDMIKEYIRLLDAQPIELPYGGHFGRSSGVKDIPEIFEIIENIK